MFIAIHRQDLFLNLKLDSLYLDPGPPYLSGMREKIEKPIQSPFFTRKGFFFLNLKVDFLCRYNKDFSDQIENWHLNKNETIQAKYLLPIPQKENMNKVVMLNTCKFPEHKVKHSRIIYPDSKQHLLQNSPNSFSIINN